MDIDHKLELGKAISAIDSIAMVLPAVGKRSDLKEIQQEMYGLIRKARMHASELEKELISLKYERPNDRFKRTKGVKRGGKQQLPLHQELYNRFKWPCPYSDERLK